MHLAKPCTTSGGERGAVLPLTLMLLVIMTMLSMALLSLGDSEVQIATNHLRSTQALNLAEAGLEDAFNTVRANPALVGAASPAPTAFPGLAGPGASLPGTYTVRYQSVGPDTISLTSSGSAGVGASQRVVRATVNTSFSMSDGIRTRANLTISGSPQLDGRCGSVHTNGNLSISGNPVVEGDATATGSYSSSGDPDIGGSSGGGRPPKPIPVINPADFLTTAKAQLPRSEIYQFKADGRVLGGLDNLIVTLSPGAEYRGWKYIPGTPNLWAYWGDTPHNGTYYFEGNAKVGGSPGSLLAAWQTTLLAQGDIDISGEPFVRAHLDDTFLVAGRDVKLSGNLTQLTKGIIAAHEQIGIVRNGRIRGFIIAEDASRLSDTVPENYISGDPRITYDCDVSARLPGPPRILTRGL